MIPLSPVPGRSLSLNLNLVPKEDTKSSRSSLADASPRKASSRATSPSPAVSNKAHPVTACPHEKEPLASSPISSDEDCFSLIKKVHTGHLHKGFALRGKKWKRDCGKVREKAKQGKGKGGGKKDRK